MSPKDFQVFLAAFPSLSTLVIRGLEEPSHTVAGDEAGRLIDAPSLRFLAVSIANHTNNCECFLPFLSMKNLEYLEVAYLVPTFTAHHASIVSQWKNLPKLRKFRISSVSIWRNDLSFLSSLPATVDLEIIGFPWTQENSALTYILKLTNLKSITFDLSPPRISSKSIDFRVFSDTVSQHNLKLRCPTSLRLKPPQVTEIPVLELDAVGNMFSVTALPTTKGFLDDYLAKPEEEEEDSLWGEGDDEEFEDFDGGYDDGEEYDTFEYDERYLHDDDDFESDDEAPYFGYL